MSTPHISANKGDFAPTVLMPGDPLRAKFIADTYLENVVEVNRVRGMLGYTGTYKGKPVSVMGSGMGIPSIGIYSYELYTQFDVENIIRVGSCGSYDKNLNLFDLVLVTEAYSNSTFANCQNGFEANVLPSHPQLTENLRQSAKSLEIPLVEGPIYSSDVFYYEPVSENQRPRWQIMWEDFHCLGTEMESFGLFHMANVTGKKAACLLTVSDSVVLPQETTPQEREKSFTTMMEVALGTL